MSILFLAGCPFDPKARIYNPAPKDVKGQWETLSINQLAPYALLEFDSKGDGKLVFVTDKDVSDVLYTSEFKSSKDGFTIKAHFPEDDAEIIEGSIVYGQLCFKLEDSSELGSAEYICFTRAEKIPEYRKKANDKISATKK